MIAPGIPFNGPVHHFGYASKSIERDLAAWTKLGFRVEGDVFEDPVQRIRGQFLTNAQVRIELVMPTTDDSPVQSYLRAGHSFYHVAFEVEDLHQTLADFEKAGARTLVKPVAAVGFGGREIAFQLFPNRMLVEFVSLR